MSGLSVLENPLIEMTPIRAVFDRHVAQAAPGELSQERPLNLFGRSALSRRWLLTLD